MQEITYQELQQMREQDHDLLVIDVREAYEYADDNLPNSINIPMSELATRTHEIPKEGDVVLYCRSGSRSGYAVQALTQAGWKNLINLRGGIMLAR